MRLQHHPVRCRKGNRTGWAPPLAAFTLIELMVVIVLIAVMTAMIIPEMKGTYEEALLRSTARKLSDVFQLANSRAITLNQLHRVRIDPRNGRFVVERSAHGEEGGSKFTPLVDVAGAEGDLDKRITLEIRPADAGLSNLDEPGTAGIPAGPEVDVTREEAIAFYPDGTADSGEIHLRDRQGFGLALRVNPTTARVRVVQLEHQ